MSSTDHPSTARLPDPHYDRAMYQDVPAKRLIAWIIDVVVISVIVGFLVMMSVFTALLFLPLVFASVSFFYRWMCLSGGSATLGMYVMAIELRTMQGARFDRSTALLHTLGYMISVVTVPLQLVSVAMMAMGRRGQGLTDTVLGTVAINRTVR